jgi:hypothetical protein
LVAEGANKNDFKLAEPALENIEIERPKPTKKHPQNIRMDKGYDYTEVISMTRMRLPVHIIASRSYELRQMFAMRFELREQQEEEQQELVSA